LRTVLGDAVDRACTAGPGCLPCGGRGTMGRTVLAEVITPDERFFALVRSGDKAAALRYWLADMGGITMVEHAIEKVRDGLVDPVMAERAVGWLQVQPRVQRNSHAL
jgi:general secretion pathway protein E